MTTIAIIGAMPEEISIVQTALIETKRESVGACTFYKGHINHANVVLTCSGIGKVHAAVAATLIIQRYQPVCIINIGTLGALHGHLAPGAIILSESISYHDVDVTAFGYMHGQIPQMPPDYQSSHQLLHLFENLARKTNLPLHKGAGVTGDQFVNSVEKLNTIKERFPFALGIDMESAAIAHVAHLFNVPFISVRAVTDSADEAAAEVSTQNLVRAADIVGNLVINTIADVSKLLVE